MTTNKQNQRQAQQQVDQLVVCHDIGAANFIMAHERALDFPSAAYCLFGPAKKAWEMHIPNTKLKTNYAELIPTMSSVRTGTGWGSDIEHQARKIAKQNKLKVSALVDHWVNYDERFSRNKEYILPDTIEVVDEYAFELCRTHFASLEIQQIPNVYLDNCVTEISPPKRNGDILYLSQPIRVNWPKHSAPPEIQAFELFLKHRKTSTALANLPIRIRLHPAESATLFNQWLAKHPRAKDFITFDDSETVENSISKAKVVVGLETYAMVIALAAEREVYSSIPAGVAKARLPYQGIRHLQEFY